MAEELDTVDYKRLLGFTIPGMTPKESYEYCKTNFKKEFPKLMQDYSKYKGDELDKGNKSKPKSPERNKKNGSTSKSNYLSQISHMKLNPVETAFFVASLKSNAPILCDADANKNKTNNMMGEGDDEINMNIKLPDIPNNEQNIQIAENEQVQCICGKEDQTKDPAKVWFYCDGCEVWFHPECLGLTKEQIDACQKKGDEEPWFHSEECRENSKKKNKMNIEEEGENVNENSRQNDDEEIQ